MRIGFIGFGKLGQPCGEVISEKGHDVVAYDVADVDTTVEMKDSIEEVVKDRNIVFIAVPTPHDPAYDGSAPTYHLPPKDFSYDIVIDVIKEANKHMNKDQLLVLISTVLPGTVRREFVPLVTNTRFVYNPYLIAMGTVAWDMVNPEMVMIGTEDGSETGDAKELVDFYKTIMQNTPRYIIGTWDETECIKVFYNTFISAKVSLVNMIQDVAENLGNINAEVVCDALATSDRRIMGPGYMKPGMGDGGACHPRDNIALRWMAEELNLGYDLFDAVMLSREKQAENMSRRLCDLAEGDWHPTTRTMIGALPVVIVGKAYKPLVEYEAGSASMLVGHYVKNSGHELHYYDEKTGDMPPQSVLDKPAVYLLAHNPGITYGDQLDTVPGWYGDHKVTDCDDALVSTGNGTELNFAPGSIVVDPWRKTPDIEGVQVIHYGNTRGK